MIEKLKLTNQVCFPLYNLTKEVINLYRPILLELDLTYPQYLVMLVLWEEDAQKVSEIGYKLNLDTGTLTPLLKRLEKKQLIERKRNTKDERVVLISLTEEGKKMRKNAEHVPGQIVDSLNISNEKLQVFKEVIEEVLNHIKYKICH